MFRCKKCGAEFRTPGTVIEKHNLDTPPYEERSVCPDCRSDKIIPLINDAIKRTFVIDRILRAERFLNVFESKIEHVINQELVEILYQGMSELWELFDYLSVGDSDYSLPLNTDEIFFAAKSEDDVELLSNLAKRYIVGR